MSRSRASSCRRIAALVAACALMLGAGVSYAENVDPDNDGSQYAYAENVGWINAEPDACADCGLEVTDAELLGWLWGENVGWVNMSCSNRSTCGDVDFRVANDGCGDLSGYAWSENAGWISFSCENTSNCASVDYGVTIDPQTGDFAGYAWSENAGWLSFADDSPVPYGIKTAWRGLVPADLVAVTAVGKTALEIQLEWAVAPGASGYDVLRGRLSDLRSSGGDFSTAVDDCVAEDQTATDLDQPLALGSGADFFIVRAVNCGGAGSVDSGGPNQAATRDPGVQAAAATCN